VKIIIASYPRSGQSYIQSTLTLAFSKEFGFSHLNKPGDLDQLKKYDHVVTLVRNPLESIASIVAMELEFFADEDIDSLIKKRIEEYQNFYSLIVDYANTFIDFDQINTHFEKILKHVSVVSGYPILNSKPSNIVSDMPSQKFLKTSKNSKNYLKSLEYLRKYNLDLCFDLYYYALERCVDLDEL
jgi:hypothetical protein